MAESDIEISKRRKVEEESTTNNSSKYIEDSEDNENSEEELQETQQVVKDLYLDTIDRTRLDFDFEKVCSITNSNFNIYSCLICGKFFQGKGRHTHAYFHSFDEEHHVFINLDNLKVYILPDDQLVEDASLDDIKYVIKPRFTQEEVLALVNTDKPKYSFDLNNKKYLPGYIGLNNIKENDYINVIIQALTHVPPIRDYFLLLKIKEKHSQLIQRFALLCRKIYNPKAFKGQVSPHELLQEISVRSKKQFRIESRKEPIHFLSWFLNQLHKDLGGSKTKPSIITQTFQGSIKSFSEALESNPITNLKKGDKTTVDSKFLFLSLDLPPQPIFQDQEEKNIIPQIPISSLLSKFDGKTLMETSTTIQRFKIHTLPPYLILYYKRFMKNNFNFEKNHTIVTFPMTNLNLDIIYQQDGLTQYYNLLANVVHEHSDLPNEGSYSAFIQHQSADMWFKISDLTVENQIKDLIPLSETYLQIWERKK